MTVIRDLGVELETKYCSGKQRHVFLDKSKIKSIIINEGITWGRVVFYMAFIVEGRDRMVLAFEVNTTPLLQCLTRCAEPAASSGGVIATLPRHKSSDVWRPRRIAVLATCTPAATAAYTVTSKSARNH